MNAFVQLLGEPLPDACMPAYHLEQQARQLPMLRALCMLVLLAFLCFGFFGWDTEVQAEWATTALRLRLACTVPLLALLAALFALRGQRALRIATHAYLLCFVGALSLVTSHAQAGLTWALPTYMATSIVVAPMFSRWSDVWACLLIAVCVPFASLQLAGPVDEVVRINYVFYMVAAVGVALLLYVQGERERRRAYRLELGLQQAAHNDGLTGLLSRSRFLELAHARLARGDHEAVLVYLDLDHFKRVNDDFGHDAGDQALRDTAQAIREAIDRDDLCARLGGEEFVLLLPASEGGRVEALCDGLLVRIRRLSAGGRPLSASLGVARREGPGEPLGTLMRRADHAMLEAKRTGKGRWCEARGGGARIPAPLFGTRD